MGPCQGCVGVSVSGYYRELIRDRMRGMRQGSLSLSCATPENRKGASAAPPLKGNLGDGAAGKEGLGLDDIDEPHGHSDDEGRARTFFQHVTGDAGQRERGIADEDDGPVE